MARSGSYFHLVFILLPLLISGQVDSVDKLDPVDKACEEGINCVHKNECETFKRATSEFRTLERGSCKWKEALAELKGQVCNKKESGVCCKKHCGLREVCTPMDECPSFAAQKNKLKNTSPSNPERQKLLESIKKRICNKTTQLVCCERKDSRCVAIEEEIVPQTLGKSCDPANGSCLPDVERCGQAGGEQRVVGGENALPGEFPFTALLGRKAKKRGPVGPIDVKIFTCGGTLINLRYVITAAHCHHATQRRRQISLVRLGEYEVTDANRPDCVGGGDNFCLEDPQDFDIAPEDVVLHPDYGKDRQKKLTNTINDIALIRLPRLAKENLAVRVVCLPILPKVAAEQLNVPDLGIGLTSFYPTVVGWGHTEGDPLDQEFSGVKQKVASSIQQKLAIPVLDNMQCGAKLFDFVPREDQICAGGEVGKDSCGGDSGGPLYMRYIIDGQKKSAYFDNSKPWYLLGIVSFGTKKCGSGNPAIYTRVESFVPWIRENIKD